MSSQPRSSGLGTAASVTHPTDDGQCPGSGRVDAFHIDPCELLGSPWHGLSQGHKKPLEGVQPKPVVSPSTSSHPACICKAPGNSPQQRP